MSQRRLEQTISSAYKASLQADKASSSTRDAIASFVGDPQETWRRPHGYQVTPPGGQPQEIRQYMLNHTLRPSWAKGGITALEYLQSTRVTAWHALKGPYAQLMFPKYDSCEALDNALSRYAGMATSKMALSLHRLSPPSTDSLFDKLEACSTKGYVPNAWLLALLPLVEEHFDAVFKAGQINGKPSHRVCFLKVRQMAPAVNLLPTVATAVEQFGRLSSNNKTSKELKTIVSRLCVSDKLMDTAQQQQASGDESVGMPAAAGSPVTAAGATEGQQMDTQQQQAALGGPSMDTGVAAAAAVPMTAVGVTEEQQMDIQQQQAVLGGPGMDTAAATIAGSPVTAVGVTEEQQINNQQQQPVLGGLGMDSGVAAAAGSPVTAVGVVEGQEMDIQQPQAAQGGPGMDTGAAVAAGSPVTAVGVTEEQQMDITQQQAVLGGPGMDTAAAAAAAFPVTAVGVTEEQQMDITQQQAVPGGPGMDTGAAAIAGSPVTAVGVTEEQQMDITQQQAVPGGPGMDTGAAAIAGSPVTAVGVTEEQRMDIQQQAVLGGPGMDTGAVAIAGSPVTAVGVTEEQQMEITQQQAVLSGPGMDTGAAASSSGVAASHTMVTCSRAAQGLYRDVDDVPVAHNAECEICSGKDKDLVPYGCGYLRHSLCRYCKQRWSGQPCPWCRAQQEPCQVAVVEGQRLAAKRGVEQRRAMSSELDQEDDGDWRSRRNKRQRTGARQQQQYQAQEAGLPSNLEQGSGESDAFPFSDDEVAGSKDDEGEHTEDDQGEHTEDDQGEHTEDDEGEHEYDVIDVCAEMLRSCLEDFKWHERVDDRVDKDRLCEMFRLILHTSSSRHA